MTTLDVWFVVVNHINELWKNPVKISIPTDSKFDVGDFRKSIIKHLEPDLDKIHHSTLTVYRCKDRGLLTGLEDIDLQEKLKTINLRDRDVIEAVNSRVQIRNLGIGEEETLLVQMTTVDVCFVLINHINEPWGDPSYISIPTDSKFRVDDFKKSIIKECQLDLDKIHHRTLKVYRCKDQGLLTGLSPEELKEKLKTINLGDRDVIEAVDSRVQIRNLGIAEEETLLVQMPSTVPHVEHEEARDTLLELPFTKYRNKRLGELAWEIISVDNATGIRKAHSQLFTGRFDDRYGHPVAVFHRELALLERRLKTLDAQVETGRDWSYPKPGPAEVPAKVPADIKDIARAFFENCRKSYASEREHSKAMIPIFNRIFQSAPRVEQYTRATTGSKQGNNRVDAAWGDWVVFEDKQEYGVGGDPSLQGAVWYAKHCDATRSTVNNSKLPVIIIGMTGHVIEVSIAVCLEEVLVNKILHFAVLSDDCQETTIDKLALITSALRACGNKLKLEYLDATPSELVSDKKETWHLPCPSVVVPSLNSTIHSLEFKAKLGRNNQELTKIEEGESPEMHPLFLAKYSDDEVVVKFTARYNQVAHRALEKANYAPRLYGCERVVGGVEMVVMERLPADRTTRMFDKDNRSLPRSVFEDLEAAMEIIHGAGLVHGDLRATNVMITRSLDDAMSVKLIDFDWTGCDGVAEYPHSINCSIIGHELATDVGPSQTMCKKHDDYALSILISRYCKDEEYRNTKFSELRLDNGYDLEVAE